MDKYFDYFWAAAASALRFYQLFAARPKMLTAPRISTPSLFVAVRELDECCMCVRMRERGLNPTRVPWTWTLSNYGIDCGFIQVVVKTHIAAVIPQIMDYIL
jgi:hypothetical protein